MLCKTNSWLHVKLQCFPKLRMNVHLSIIIKCRRFKTVLSSVSKCLKTTCLKVKSILWHSQNMSNKNWVYKNWSKENETFRFTLFTGINYWSVFNQMLTSGKCLSDVKQEILVTLQSRFQCSTKPCHRFILKINFKLRDELTLPMRMLLSLQKCCMIWKIYTVSQNRPQTLAGFKLV